VLNICKVWGTKGFRFGASDFIFDEFGKANSLENGIGIKYSKFPSDFGMEA